MRRTLCALLTIAGMALVSLAGDTACSSGPKELCRGVTVNAKPGVNGEVDDNCTECVEATCCDLVGDCQGTECATEVTGAHKCVLQAGRAAPVRESDCRTASLRSEQSQKVYACMRQNCDDECGLPTCQLEPLVPFIGGREGIACDRCFAQGCCSLMNECAKNRTCLLALRCILEECSGDFARELRKENHAEAVQRRDRACSVGGGRPPNGDAGDNDDTNCFSRCIELTFVADSEEAAKAQCLAAKINECGADVDCGESCAAGARDAAPEASPMSDAAAD